METLTLQVGKKEVELPEELSVQQYQELRNLTNYNSPIKFIAAMTGLDESDIKYSKKKDMDFVYKFLVAKYLNNKDQNLETIVNVNGNEYGFNSDITQLNFGAWVDLEMYVADGIEKNLHNILAIMYRPITKRTKKGFELEEYDSDTAKTRAEQFLEAPIRMWFGSSKYFFLFGKMFLNNMKDSLVKQKKNLKNKRIAKKRLNKMISPLKKVRDVFTGSAS